MKIAQTFAALKSPNYRLWFGGQLISLFGTWMQITAQSFLVFELTHSPAYLGYVSFAFGIPSWIFMLYGGVIADRVPRRTLLIYAQCSMMIMAFVLAGVTFAGLVQPWHIVVFVLGLGLANAFDAPARQAFVIELVDREDISNAVALNSTLFNMSSVVGPAVAGVVYAMVGPAWCFTVNGLSFIAVIVALFLMKVKTRETPRHNTSALSSLKEGVRYVYKDSLIRTLMCLVAVTAMFGFAYTTLIPAWAVTILGGDATTNGLLHSARGAGAVLSALLIAYLGRFTFKGKLLTAGTFLLPVLLIAFALVRWLPAFTVYHALPGGGPAADCESCKCAVAGTGLRRSARAGDEHIQPYPFWFYAHRWPVCRSYCGICRGTGNGDHMRITLFCIIGNPLGIHTHGPQG